MHVAKRVELEVDLERSQKELRHENRRALDFSEQLDQWRRLAGNLWRVVDSIERHVDPEVFAVLKAEHDKARRGDTSLPVLDTML